MRAGLVPLALAGGLVSVLISGEDGERELSFSQNYACDDCGISIDELTPRLFSFNNPYGACPKCGGLGVQLQMTPKDMGLLMGGIKIEGVDGPFYRKNRLVEESPEKPVGEWNKMEFLCKGGEIKVWLNGILVNDAVCDATEGYIAIQSEGGAMDFRNIVLSF